MESFQEFEIRLKNYLLSHDYYAVTPQGIEDIVDDIIKNALEDVSIDRADVIFFADLLSEIPKNFVACFSKGGPTWKGLKEKYGEAQLDETSAYHANVALFNLNLDVQAILKDGEKTYIIKDIQISSMFSYIQEAFDENIKRISERHERERRLFVR